MSSPETRQALREALARLPRGPGVYLFKDAKGDVLYIGKAKSLRERVRSYFQARGDGRPQVRFIGDRVEDVEVIVTRSEKEAFLLENNLIKRMKPRFNIRLKDDKTYLHLRVDRKHPYPAIVPVRRPRKDGAQYFGPYSSARAIRTTLRMLRGVYPLRDCSDHELQNRSRPCLKYQIKLCAAPCVDYVTPEDYAAHLDGAVSVLKGDTAGLREHMAEEMQAASESQEYERAAMLRDRIAYLQNSTDTQAVELNRTLDRDVVGLCRRGRAVEVAVLLFRGGKLLSVEPYSFDTELPDDEALSMFLGQYYHPGRPVPAEVLLPSAAYAMDTLEALLAERRQGALRIRVPHHGEGRRAVEMAGRNAEMSQEASSEQHSLNVRILEDVQERLGLPVVPRTVECIDVSHLQGSHTVASLVRFVDGEPDKNGYRRFRIRSAGPGDDYAAMREVVRRRFGPRAAVEGLPDLLLVDGGKGQVSSARKALAEVGRSPAPVAEPGERVAEASPVTLESSTATDPASAPALAGMIKPRRRGRGLRLGAGEEERIALPDRAHAVVLTPESEACYFLQRVRDEAHRFAITYHRRLRSRGQQTSVLEDVEGLGSARARTVLQHFGGLRELKAASREQLAEVPGIGPTLAGRIYAHLHPTAGLRR